MALTQSQKLTLRTHVQANTTVLPFSGGDAQIAAVFAGPSLGAGDAALIAEHYNALGAAGTHTAWKSLVPIGDIGRAINAAELGGLSTLNNTRIQTLCVLLQGGVSPALASQRAFWDDVFSGAGGVNTRAALLALWKRLMRNVEKVFATGTGSDASPATLTFEGTVDANDIQDIHGLPA